MINIVVVEDDTGNKDEITKLVSVQSDLEILGLGKDNYDAISLVKKFKPDILLLDTEPEIDNKTEISCILKRYSPKTAIVIICARVRDSIIYEMAKGTITGYLLKDSDMSHLIMILREIYRGVPYINYQITVRMFQILAKYDREKAVFSNKTRITKKNFTLAKFTDTEFLIFKYISEGYSVREAAKFLCLKEGTVRNYISSIMQKTGSKTRTQIVLYARKCQNCETITDCNPLEKKGNGSVI